MDDDDYFILGLFANLFTSFKTSSHIDKAGILEILADVSYLYLFSIYSDTHSLELPLAWRRVKALKAVKSSKATKVNIHMCA